VLLGPSFAFGWGVNHEDSFAAKLEEILEKNNYAGGRDIEIINAGVPSLNALKQLNWYKNKGKEYNADLVIQFIDGNMVVGNWDDRQYDISKEGYIVIKKLTIFETIRKKILRYSATVHYSWMAYCKIKASLDSSNSRNQQIIGAGRELENYIDFELSNPKIGDALSYYSDLRVSVELSGADLFILHFPLSYCVHPQDIPRWEIYGVKAIDKQIRFNQEFCQYLNDRGFNCLNVTQNLIQEANEGRDRLYYYLDLHWTPKGNLIVARSTAKRLLEDWDKES
jgi:hypothetical protein